MDREKIIKGLNDIGSFIAGRVGFEQARNFLRTIDDALALLKEQEEQIKTMHIAQNVIADYLIQPEIVRCKDCKHILPKGFCHKHSRKVTDDWFCADGERRVNE